MKLVIEPEISTTLLTNMADGGTPRVLAICHAKICDESQDLTRR